MTDLDSISLDRQTPQQHRRRYDALRAQAHVRPAGQPQAPCPPIADDRVILRETIPGGWYWAARVTQGQTLRVHSPAGGASVALVLWNAGQPSERFNAPDTMKLQWTVRIGAGQLILSDMGRVMAAVTADDGGCHDLLLGGSTEATNQARYGDGSLRNTRDNLRLAAAKLGLDRRDIPPCLTLFADVRVDAGGTFAWHGAGVAGAAIDLRAEMNLLVALSNCPHPIDPAPFHARPPIEAIVWDAGPAPPHDPCRTAGPEAQRAYENTKAMLHV